MWKVQHVEEGKQLGRRMGLTGQCSFSGRISASMDGDLGRVASSSRSQSLSHRRVVARRACKQRTTTWSLVHRINRCQELKTNSNIAHDRSSVLSQILQRRRKMARLTSASVRLQIIHRSTNFLHLALLFNLFNILVGLMLGAIRSLYFKDYVYAEVRIC